MKGFIGLVSLVVFLALAYVIQSSLHRSVQDQEVVEWSNSLIWSALGAQSTVSFDSPLVEPDGDDGRWRISGEIGLRSAAGAVLQEPYAAVIKQICQPTNERSCWRLEALTIGQQVVDVSELESFETAEPRAADLPLAAPLAQLPAQAQAQAQSQAQPQRREQALAQPQTQVTPLAAATDIEPDTATGNGALGGRPAPDQPQLQPLPAETDVTPVVAPVEAPGIAPRATATQAAATQAAADSTMQQAPLTYVSRRELILGIQSQLSNLGINPGPIDGQMGPQTRAAIEIYQQAQGLAVDGKATGPLLEHLMQQP